MSTTPTEIRHLTPAEKTTAIIVLAEALYTTSLCANSAPILTRLHDWMSAPPSVGDVVLEMSTKHRGPSPHRIGVVNEIRYSRRHRDRIVEILVIDPPCGNDQCTDRKCVHRPRWSDASFVRVPVTVDQLAEATGMRPGGAGVDRDDLVSLLGDFGIPTR